MTIACEKWSATARASTWQFVAESPGLRRVAGSHRQRCRQSSLKVAGLSLANVRLPGRPRQRVHPVKPKVGIRAARANEIWHIDTTVIRLLDGSRVYLRAVIDNFSRRILAW